MGNKCAVSDWLDTCWKIAMAALLTGNALGMLEIIYIVTRLRMLKIEGVFDFLSFLGGGAFIYGMLMTLFLGVPLYCISFLFSFDFNENRHVRLIVYIVASIVAIFSVPFLSQVIYYDIPGLDEVYRFWHLIISAVILFLGIYLVLTRYVPCERWVKKRWTRSAWKYLAFGLLGLNVVFFLVSLPDLYLETPPTEYSVESDVKYETPVIYLGIDTLRADHLLPYNSETEVRSKAAKILARDGVTYKNNYAQWPKTTPSFASIFTSLYPAEIPMYGNSRPIPDKRVTWAEFMKQHGYRTQAIVSSFAVHGQYLGQGFDNYVNREDWGYKNMKFLRYLLHLFRKAMPTTMAVDWIESKPPEPFFLFLHYITPHSPYHPPYPYNKTYDTGYWGYASGSHSSVQAMKKQGVYRSPEDVEHVESLYDGDVAYTEHEVKRILDALKRAGLYKKSLIVYNADHGETMKQHHKRAWFRHSTHYQSDLDVPLIIKYPGNRHAGEKVEWITSNLDVLPTVLKELGMNVPEYFRGESIRPEDLQGPIHKNVKAQKSNSGSLRNKRWKFIYHFEEAQIELYDLKSDPAETNNVASKHPKKVKKFKSELKQFYEEHYRTPGKREYSEREKQRLKGLGYLQD
ncbi:MAG: sulfatase [bacterium]